MTQPYRLRILAGAARLALAIPLLAAAAVPARADQNVEVTDNASVECTVSARELTRVSLVGDEFASVSKVQPENPLDDFDVVNEPTRGDIYISVPGGFRPKSLSFFGTSKKGFVYKFACSIAPVGAQQLFLANRGAEAKAAAADGDEAVPDSAEGAVRLIQAMASERPQAGYAYRRPGLEPVQAGSLSVELVAEYGGIDLIGRTLRIRNLGARPVTLSTGMVAPPGSVAVSLQRAELPPRQETAAYIVMHQEGASAP